MVATDIFGVSLVVGARSPKVLAGQLPPRVLGYVIEWAALHQEELHERILPT